MHILLFIIALAAFCSPLNAQTSTPPVPTYLPVPSSAVEPAIPSVGYRVQSFGDGAYMITDGVYQSLFFVSNESVIAVDAPPTIGHNLLRGIRTVTNLPVSHMVYSHAHADHIGAAYLLTSQNTTIIAQEETYKALGPAVDNTRPLPNVNFTQDYQLNVGNQSLQLSYKGPNHEPGNIFIYAPVPKILMVVDVVYPSWVPFANLAESKNIPDWIHAHDQILDYNFTYYIGGHLNRPGTRDDILIQKEYMTDLFANCAQAIRLTAEPANATNPLSANTSLAGVSAANPNNPWAVVRYTDDFIADWCNNKTNEKWLTRLAGVDVYGFSNAATLVESLRIDYGILGAAGVQNS